MDFIEYFKIYAKAVSRKIEIPFNCYVYLKKNDRYVTYIRKDEIPKPGVLKKINENTVKEIFIKNEDLNIYIEFLNKYIEINEDLEDVDEFKNELNKLKVDDRQESIGEVTVDETENLSESYDILIKELADIFNQNGKLEFSSIVDGVISKLDNLQVVEEKLGLLEVDNDFCIDYDGIKNALNQKIINISKEHIKNNEDKFNMELKDPQSDLWEEIFTVSGMFEIDDEIINVNGKVDSRESNDTLVRGQQDDFDKTVLVKGKKQAVDEKLIVTDSQDEKEKVTLVKGGKSNDNCVIKVDGGKVESIKQEIVKAFGLEIEKQMSSQIIKGQNIDEGNDSLVVKGEDIELAISKIKDIVQIVSSKDLGPQYLEAVDKLSNSVSFIQGQYSLNNSSDMTKIQFADMKELNSSIEKLETLKRQDENFLRKTIESESTTSIQLVGNNQVAGTENPNEIILKLQKIIDKQKEALQMFEGNNNDLKEEIIHLKSENRKLLEAKEGLLRCVDEKDNIIEKQNKNVVEFEKELKLRNEEIEEQKAQQVRKDDQIKEFYDFVNNNTEYIGKLEKENEEVHKHNFETRTDIEGLRKEIRNWSSSVIELEMELKKSRDKGKQYKESIEEFTYNDGYLKKQITQLEEVIRSFDRGGQSLEAYTDSNASLVVFLQEKDNLYEKERDKVTNLKSKISTFEREKTGRDVVEDQLNTLRYKLSDNLDMLEEKNKIFTKQEETYRSKITTLHNLNDKNRMAVQRLTRMNERYKLINRDVANSKAEQVDETPELNKQIKNINVELSNKKILINQLEKKFIKLAQEKNEIQAKYNEVLNKIKDEQENEAPELNKQMKNIYVELSNTQGQVDQLGKRVTKLTQEKNDVQAKYNDALKKIKVLEYDLKKAA